MKLLVQFWLLSGHLFGNNCQLGWPFVLICLCLFVFLFISHVGIKSGSGLLIATVPVHCFSITFKTACSSYTMVISCICVHRFVILAWQVVE